MREAGAKCGFRGDEYASRLVDQFILGLRDRTTQSKLLQEPPANLDDALLIARRFEAANATVETLLGQGPSTSNVGMIGTVSSRDKTVTCLACNGFGHVAEQCPTGSSFNNFKPTTQSIPKVCYFCQKREHMTRNC